MKDNYLYQWETHIIHPLDYSTITVHTFIEETNNQEAITKRKLHQRKHIRHRWRHPIIIVQEQSAHEESL